MNRITCASLKFCGVFALLLIVWAFVLPLKNAFGQSIGSEEKAITESRPYDYSPATATGDLDMSDAIAVLKLLAGLDPGISVPPGADSDGDGKIGMAEAIYVLQIVSGLRVEPTPGLQCPEGPFLTVSPVDYDAIGSVVPLGNLNPPGHVFPTDHMYIYLKTLPGENAPELTTLYSPGNLFPAGVRAAEHVNAGFTDYSILLQPCESVSLDFEHVTSLAEAVFGDVSSFTGWVRQETYTTGGETYNIWWKSYGIDVSAGTVLGTVGGNVGQWALDVGVYDERQISGTPANPNRWTDHRYVHAAPMFDYYEQGPDPASVFNRLLAFLNREAIPGDTHPFGAVIQDIYGTAQGSWFKPGEPSPYPEDPHLALVRDNIKPSWGAISVGTSVPSLVSTVYFFIPAENGVLNRRFSEILPGSTIYRFNPFNDPNVIILLQLPNAETLRIEGLLLDQVTFDPDDPSSWNFTDGAVEFVR